jgi:hypothetical protein
MRSMRYNKREGAEGTLPVLIGALLRPYTQPAAVLPSLNPAPLVTTLHTTIPTTTPVSTLPPVPAPTPIPVTITHPAPTAEASTGAGVSALTATVSSTMTGAGSITANPVAPVQDPTASTDIPATPAQSAIITSTALPTLKPVSDVGRNLVLFTRLMAFRGSPSYSTGLEFLSIDDVTAVGQQKPLCVDTVLGPFLSSILESDTFSDKECSLTLKEQAQKDFLTAVRGSLLQSLIGTVAGAS